MDEATKRDEIEEKAAKVRFLKRPHLSTAAAKKGSPYDISTICDSIINKSCPPSKLVASGCAAAEGLLVVDYHQPWHITTKAIMRAILAFNVLERSSVRDRERLDALLRSPELRLLIWEWTTDMVRNFEEAYAEGRMPASIQMAHLEVIVVANKFLARGHLCPWGVDRFREILAGLTRVCLLDHSYGEEVLICKAIGAISVPLYRCTLPDCPQKKDVILEAALDVGFRHKDFMRLLLQRLREAAKEDRETYLNMFFPHVVMCLVAKRFGEEDLTCHYHFVSLGGVKTVVGMLLDAFNRPLDDPSDFTLDDARRVDVNTLGSGFHILLNVFNSIGNLRPLKQALRCGIMKALIFASLPQVYARVDERCKSSISRIVADVFGSSLLIQQNFRRIRRALQWYRQFGRTCECGECYGLEELLRHSDAIEDWSKLFSELKSMHAGYNLLDSQRRSEQVACGNPACAVKRSRRSLLNCAGCSMVPYCSLSCQAKAWNEHDHKEMCCNYQALVESINLTPKDIYFLARRAQEDIRMRAFSMLTMYEKLGENVSLSTHSFLVTYWVGDRVSAPVMVGLYEKANPGSRHELTPASACAPIKCPVVWPAEVLDPAPSATNGDAAGGASADGGKKGDYKDFVQVHFAVGGAAKVLLLETNFSWAALEGRECNCRRLHHGVTWTRELNRCPVHDDT